MDAPSFTIATDTVRSRVKAQTELTKSSTGIAIPMATVEPLLVEKALEKGTAKNVVKLHTQQRGKRRRTPSVRQRMSFGRD